MLALSPVSAVDAPALTQIIRAGKAHWGYPAEWLRVWEDELAITPEQIAAWHVRAATAEGKVVGFFALVHKGAEWWLEHLWLATEFIGHGYGRELFRCAVGAAAELGATHIRIEADPNAVGFYLHFGAKRDGERISTAVGVRRVIPHLIYVVSHPEST